jgi:methylthioribose-1-phosphate isomerase
MHVKLGLINRSPERAFFLVSVMRTVEWNPEKFELNLIDQRILPGQFQIFVCRSSADVIMAIQEMVVRGAPAIGAAAAFGIALAACHSTAGTVEELRLELNQAAQALLASRPTAVNLAWAVRRMLEACQSEVNSVEDMRQVIVDTAQALADEDVRTNLRLAEVGSSLIDDGDTILHHCNTGALATVDWGTALGVIRLAHQEGKRVHVLVDETRPRLQGARLTAWELDQYGIPYEIISDGAAGYFLRSGQVQKVFFGADRVAANGDVANKVGTYMLALAASTNHVPVYAVFPISTLDLSLPTGDLIPIEERSADEVLDIAIKGVRATPLGAKARNPAFDITPHYLITGLVTENGIAYPPFGLNLPRLARGDIDHSRLP